MASAAKFAECSQKMSNSEGPAIKTFGQVLPGVTYIERPGAYGFLQNDKSEIALVNTSFGYFLPGGGLDRGEDELTGLAREIREELGFEVIKAVYLMKAAQFHWSEFYGSHFRKVGFFFEVEFETPSNAACAPDHHLVWMPLPEAARTLTQEFQRWAVTEYLKLNP